MPFQPVLNTVECALKYTIVGGSGKPAYNILHFLKATNTVWDAEELQAFVEEAISVWGSTVAPLVSDNVQLSAVRAKQLNTENDLEFDGTAAVAGTVDNNKLSSNVTIAIAKQTGFTGRSFRGRIFHYGLAQSQVVGDFLATGVAASLLTAWASFFSDLASAGFDHVLVSRWEDGVLRDPAIRTLVTNYALTDSRVDTMKRRLIVVP